MIFYHESSKVDLYRRQIVIKLRSMIETQVSYDVFTRENSSRKSNFFLDSYYFYSSASSLVIDYCEIKKRYSILNAKKIIDHLNRDEFFSMINAMSDYNHND